MNEPSFIDIDKILITSWLNRFADPAEMESMDSWHLYEAVVYVVLGRPFPAFLEKQSDWVPPFLKVIDISKGTDTEISLDQLEELLKACKDSLRALMGGKIGGLCNEGEGRFWVQPEYFMQWWRSRVERNAPTVKQRKEVREFAYREIVEFAKSLPKCIALPKLLERKEISEQVEAYCFLAPSQDYKIGRGSLLDRLRKDDAVPKVRPGAPKKKNK